MSFFFHFAPASTGSAAAWTPADLTITSGRVRNWWHFADSPTVASLSNGTGSVAIDDPVGYIASQATESTYANTNSDSATKPLLKADSLYFAEGGLLFPQGMNFGPTNSHGLTIAWRFKAVSDGPSHYFYNGYDNPNRNALALIDENFQAKNQTGAGTNGGGVDYDASALDLTQYHTVIAVWTPPGTVRLYLDSDTATSTVTTEFGTATWTRELFQAVTGAYYVRGKLIIDENIDLADIPNLRAWLER